MEASTPASIPNTAAAVTEGKPHCARMKIKEIKEFKHVQSKNLFCGILSADLATIPIYHYNAIQQRTTTDPNIKKSI